MRRRKTEITSLSRATAAIEWGFTLFVLGALVAIWAVDLAELFAR